MSRLTYKILMDPTTIETFVQELTVPTPLGEHPLGKKRMTNEEVESKWTKEEFIDELSRYGYTVAAHSHIENNKLFENRKK